jgi:hypothetical protein
LKIAHVIGRAVWEGTRYSRCDFNWKVGTKE